MTVMSVDHLHDMDMVDSAGQRIGSVKDLMIDANTGQMRYVVLAPGQSGIAGALGIGERLVPIPFGAVHLESGQMLLARNAAELEGAPGYTRSHPPSFDEVYEQELARYWSTGAPESMEAAGLANLTAGGILSDQLPSVTASAGMAEVARALAEKQAEAAQVLDGEGRVIGVVTLRDIALAFGRVGQPAVPAAGVQPPGVQPPGVAPVDVSGAQAGQANVAGVPSLTESPELRQPDDAQATPQAAAEMRPAQAVAAAPAMGEQGAAGPITQPRAQQVDARQGPEAVACPKCGHANRPTATFCASCGARLH